MNQMSGKWQVSENPWCRDWNDERKHLHQSTPGSCWVMLQMRMKPHLLNYLEIFAWQYVGGFQKYWYPKMDGENNGKPYEQMDDLGGKHPYFWRHPCMCMSLTSFTHLVPCCMEHQPLDSRIQSSSQLQNGSQTFSAVRFQESRSTARKRILPQKPTWNLKIPPWKRRNIYKPPIFWVPC